jgi:hypothetical protein
VQPDEYIETRVRQYQDWYDRKASSAKSRCLRMRGASVAGGATVPAPVDVSQATIAFAAHRDGAGADDARSHGDPVPTAAASFAKGET